jgi:peptidoglycan/xylan/chitin deacetylase (PgdA/CDA1 family)
MDNRYVASKDVYNSITDYEKSSPTGLNGFILLVHIGTDPRRTDKFYMMLPQLIDELHQKGYHFARIDELLKQ